MLGRSWTLPLLSESFGTWLKIKLSSRRRRNVFRYHLFDMFFSCVHSCLVPYAQPCVHLCRRSMCTDWVAMFFIAKYCASSSAIRCMTRIIAMCDDRATAVHTELAFRAMINLHRQSYNSTCSIQKAIETAFSNIAV